METTTQRPSLLNAALIGRFGIQTAAELIDSTLTLAAAETLSGVRCWESRYLNPMSEELAPLSDPMTFDAFDVDCAGRHLDDLRLTGLHDGVSILDCEWRRWGGSKTAICILPKWLEGRKPLRPLPVLWHETAFAEGYVPEWRGEWDDLPQGWETLPGMPEALDRIAVDVAGVQKGAVAA